MATTRKPEWYEYRSVGTLLLSRYILAYVYATSSFSRAAGDRSRFWRCRGAPQPTTGSEGEDRQNNGQRSLGERKKCDSDVLYIIFMHAMRHIIVSRLPTGIGEDRHRQNGRVGPSGSELIYPYPPVFFYRNSLCSRTSSQVSVGGAP
jgi:hypothetical protein